MVTFKDSSLPSQVREQNQKWFTMLFDHFHSFPFLSTFLPERENQYSDKPLEFIPREVLLALCHTSRE